MQAIVIVVAILLVGGYIYSRWDIRPPRHDDDDDNKPPRCPNCGW
jgi:hypothetical protein